MALVGAIILFGIFVANVAMGALADARFLSDVSEMLLLLAASVFFVAAILRHEADKKKKDNQS